MAIRTLIVEDEPLARQTLRDFAADLPWLQILGEAADGGSAVRMIDDLRPDLVFMDVQMPVLSGLQVLERIEHRPAVVFTTAFDRHAVTAFELEALDYLLKPFGRERFRQAVERVRQHLAEHGDATNEYERARSALAERGAAPLERMFVRHGARIVPVRMEQVSRIEADDDYVRLHVGGTAYLVEIALSELARRLDPARFLRIHRSHVINVGQVASMEPYDARRLLVRMQDGAEVIASRSGSRQLQALII
jgi:two-component system LytT family response regulator